MWESQLRLYRNYVERNRNFQGSPRKYQARVSPQAAYSLYSSEDGDMPTSDLDGCARLLTEILEQDKGESAVAQGEQGESKADDMKRMTKPAASAGGRNALKDRKTAKVISTKKTPTRAASAKVGRGRVGLDAQKPLHRSRRANLLLSETDDSLRSRSDGRPVPLNSSEKITQAHAVSEFHAKNRLIATDISIEGANKAKGRGNVSVGLKTPYNNRIPSSTPNLTPTKDSEKQKLLNQLLRGVVSKPGDAGSASRQQPHYEFEWPVKDNVVCADRRPPVTYAATSSHTVNPAVNTNMHPSQLVDSAAGNFGIPSSMSTNQPPHLSAHSVPYSSTQAGLQGHSSAVGHVPYYRPLTEHIHDAAVLRENAHMNLVYQLPPGGIAQHYAPMQMSGQVQAPAAAPPSGPRQYYVVPSGGYIQPHVGEAITTTAAMYSANIQPNVPHASVTTTSAANPGAAGPNTYEEYLAFRAILDREEQETAAKLAEARERAAQKEAELQQVPTREHEMETKKSRRTSTEMPPQQSTPEKERIYLVNAAVNTSDDGTQSCVDSQTQDSSKPSGSNAASVASVPVPKEKKLSEDKENKTVKTSGGKKKKKGKPNKVGIHTLRYLLRELQAVPGVTDDQEVLRIIRELDDAISNLLPSLSDLDWQTELDLAIQPLRSENAQLRRRLRILNQQVKTKDSSPDGTSNDQNFDLVHLHMLNHTLERQLKEEKVAKEQLQQRIHLLTAEVEELSNDKKAFIQLLGNKDDDHLKSQQDRVSDIAKLRSDLDVKIVEAAGLQKKVKHLEQEIDATKVTCTGKDKEITRLQHLVKSLQSSMQQLLADLSNNDLQPVHHWGSAMDHLQNACRLLDEEHTFNSSEPTPDVSRQDARKPTVLESNVSPRERPVRHAQDPVTGATLLHPRPKEAHPADTRLPQIKEGTPLETPSVVRPLTADSLHQMESQHKQAPATQGPRTGDYQHSNRGQGQGTSRSTGSRNSLDSTQYLSPPVGNQEDELTHRPDAQGGSSRKIVFDEQIDSARSTESFTVKDFLSGLIEQFREENLKHQSPGSLSTNLLSSQDKNRQNDSGLDKTDEAKNRFEGAEDDADGDSTLIEQPLDGSAHEPNQTHFSASIADQSRFSVTDYFKKYPTVHSSNTQPAKNPGRDYHWSGDSSSHIVPSRQEQSYKPRKEQFFQQREGRVLPSDDHQDFSLKKCNSNEQTSHFSSYSQSAPFATSHTHTSNDETYPKRVWDPEEMRSQRTHEENESSSTYTSSRSLQEELYRGTELDTSLSTIRDMESVMSSVSSISSLSSFNDQAFQDGLNSLDENIARIQKSLKQTALKI